MVRNKRTKKKVVKRDQYFVYLLRCADESIYTGMTNDVARRLKRHQSGAGARYTRMKGAVEVVYTEKCETMGEALKREAAIKRWSRQKKLDLITTKKK